MSDVISIREARRNAGAPGAPDSLLNSQKLNNFVDSIEYIGKGLAEDGETALEVIPWGGPGYFTAKTAVEVISGAWTFTTLPRSSATPTHADEFVRKGYVDAAIGSAGGGDMMKATYDPDNKNANAFNADNHTGGSVNGVFTVGEKSKLSGIQAGAQANPGAATTSANGLMSAADKTKLDGIEANAQPNPGVATTSANGLMSSADKTKLNGIATGATANDTDANLKNRANHTGEQAIGTVTGLSTALSNKLETSARGAVNGVASLGADGKVPVAQLPESLGGGLNYQGTWNAATNTPTIPVAAAGNKGHYRKVATPGTTAVDGIADWQVGDWIVSNGASWDKIDNTDQVSSVAGRMGAITLTLADIGGAGTIASQAANNIAITGGTLANVTLSNVILDGGDL